MFPRLGARRGVRRGCLGLGLELVVVVEARRWLRGLVADRRRFVAGARCRLGVAEAPGLWVGDLERPRREVYHGSGVARSQSRSMF